MSRSFVDAPALGEYPRAMRSERIVALPSTWRRATLVPTALLVLLFWCIPALAVPGAITTVADGSGAGYGPEIRPAPFGGAATGSRVYVPVARSHLRRRIDTDTGLQTSR